MRAGPAGHPAVAGLSLTALWARVRPHLGLAPRVYPWTALVLALGLALRALLVPITSGPDFHIWDLTAAATLHGQDVYARPPLPPDRYGPYAYVPLYLYLLASLKWLALRTGLPYVVLGKLPVVAGDVGVALGIGAALRRAGRGERARALGMALFFLNPLTLYNGAFYGRFDSLPLALLLLAWNRLPAGATGSRGGGRARCLALPYGLAVALKTFPIFLLPYLLARLGPRRGARVALAAVGLPLVVSLPYLLHDARRFLYIVFVYDSTKGPRQFSWQVALLDLGVSERIATVVSYGLLALFALALIVPLTPRPLLPRWERGGGLAHFRALWDRQLPAGTPSRARVVGVDRRGRDRVPAGSRRSRGVRRGRAICDVQLPGGGIRARADPYAYAAVALALFLLLSKVVYEQYLLWPLPFLAVLAARDRARDALGLLAALSVAGVLANRWVHPFGYDPYPALWLNGLIAVAAALFVARRAPVAWP